MTEKIGVIGLGFVGGAMEKSFIEKINEYELDINIIGYDKYKHRGSFESILNTSIVFLCLPTQYVEGYGYDLTSITQSCRELSNNNYKGLVVIKSTVEPGVSQRLSEQFSLKIVHNPEFLTARTAYEDFHNQSHIVLGITKPKMTMKVSFFGGTMVSLEHSPIYYLYERLYPDAKISTCTSEESESMKLFCNNFYAVKVQLFNEFYLLCQKTGADFEAVRDLMLENGWINKAHTNVPGPDGSLSYGGACVDPKTVLIEESRGEVNAENIAVGDQIFDGQGFTGVTKVGTRYVPESIEIKSRGRILRGSSDHIHMVFNSEKNILEEKLLGNIETSDWIYIPRSRYNPMLYVALGPKPKIKGIKNWKEEITIEPYLARLFGLYCAEGFSGVYKYSTPKREKKEYTVCWTFGEKEEFLADEVINSLSLMGIKAGKKLKVSPNATFGESRTWQVRKRSYWLYHLFKKIGLGHGAFDKGSPLLHEENAKAFISGWLDGDGFFDKSNNSISGFSRSKKLINTIDKMLLHLGIHGSITKDGQQINISMRNDVSEVLSWSSHPRFCKEPIYKTSYRWSSTNSSNFKNGWISKIQSVKKNGFASKVVSIETESGFYVANSMLTHNCFPKDTSALNRFMENNNSLHEIIEACISERNKIRED
jgi:UDP-glucose 6-dehydrogenase